MHYFSVMLQCHVFLFLCLYSHSSNPNVYNYSFLNFWVSNLDHSVFPSVKYSHKTLGSPLYIPGLVHVSKYFPRLTYSTGNHVPYDEISSAFEGPLGESVNFPSDQRVTGCLAMVGRRLDDRNHFSEFLFCGFKLSKGEGMETNFSFHLTPHGWGHTWIGLFWPTTNNWHMTCEKKVSCTGISFSSRQISLFLSFTKP